MPTKWITTIIASNVIRKMQRAHNSFMYGGITLLDSRFMSEFFHLAKLTK